MASFSHLRFQKYARELSQAVFDLSQETMGATTDLRTRLGNDKVNIRFGNNRKFVSMGETTVELHMSAGDDEVARALNIEKINGTAETPTELPKVDIAPAVQVASSNITGLQSGAFQAKLVEMRQKIADRQKQALAKIDSAVVTGAAKMDAAAEDVAVKVGKEISAALQEFAQHSNGGPA